MRMTLFILFLTLFTNPIFSQNSSYIMSEGDAYDENEGFLPKEGKLYVTPMSGSQAIYNKENIGGYFLEGETLVSVKGKTIVTHDAKTLKNRKSIPIKNFPENRKNIGCIQFQGEYIMFFSSILTKKSKTLQCFFQKLDIQTGKLGNEVAILEVENKRLNLRKNGFHHVSFFPLPEFKLSKDGSKLLFSCHEKLCVYEKGMDLSWKTDKIYGKHTPKRFYDLQNGMLDNDGTYYAILKVFKNDDNPKLEWHHWESHSELISKKDRRCNYNIIVLKIDKNGVSKIEADSLKDILLHSLTLHKDANDRLLCVGLYFKDDALFRSAGFLSVDLEKNTAPTYYPIATENQDEAEKKGGTPTKGIKYLNGIEIKNTKDGNLLLISEQVNGFYLFPSKGTVSDIGNHSDVLVSKINLDGDLLWAKRLQKSQIFNLNPKNGEAYGCESYKYLELNGKHYIIYLDDKKNKDFDFDEIKTYCSSCKNGGVFAFILDEDGNGKKEMLFDLDKLTATTHYDFKVDMRTISDTEFIFPVFQKKKNEGLIKIKVK
ncbi:hypothetical protein [Aureispira anguillae]|uniref:Uncharacterized protein n=1 Tax=Aureispira anguillae TaxID=2864201 RepID=A0A916DV49_9BACT|nr:hypothetical protein [Aureispira anguillae]BDS14754.1 hypothetical protein AsAng_0055360 [Aureispira anguillae]